MSDEGAVSVRAAAAESEKRREDRRPGFPMPPGHGRPMGGFGHGAARTTRPKRLRETLFRLWRCFEGERVLLAVVFGFVLLDAAIVFFTPYWIGKAVDALSRGQTVDWGALETATAALAAAYAGGALAGVAQGWLSAGVAQSVVERLRRAMFGKLRRLPLAYFDSRPHGELMSRLTNDLDNVSNTVSQATVQLLSGCVAVAGSLVMMLTLSWPLTLATLTTVPLVIGLVRFVTRRTSELFRQQQAKLGELNGRIEESISGLEVVRTFNREERVIAEFDRANGDLYEVGVKAQIWSGLLMPFLGVIGNFGFAVVAVVGGWLAVRGQATAGLIAAFLVYSRQFVRPLNDLANLYNLLLAGVAGAERVFETLDEREESADPPDAVELKRPRGEVVFENVSFGYRPEVPVLRDVHFRAAAGTRTALVGPTGAGKTTIVQLLMRFYDATGGRILIDGCDIRSYTRDSLRRCFGVVLQDTYLFAGTVRDNIRYGKPDATDAEVRRAAALACADSFIERLPRGYDTMLSENGGNLSQGERQLLAIARVILADPPILILDEATSNVDTRTERHIQRALRNLMEGRTCFIIAHRLNTIRDADMILVIDGGRIVEWGTHESLMQQGGFYRRMFENQFGTDRSAAVCFLSRETLQ